MSKSLTVLIALAAASWLLPGPQGAALGADIVSVEPVDGSSLPPPLDAGQLEDLVGPVALYPDDLLAIVLPASTYPLDIVKAARFLETRDADSSAEPDPAWDESVVALLNYPEVVTLLNSDLDWTWALGEAVLYQEEDLIAAVERFRGRAVDAGNLSSDKRQEVIVDEGAITIAPVSSEVIYVPYYEPRQVVVYSRTPVYHYYPRPYPVYYYPYAANHHFSNGFFWGVSTAFHISFRSRNLRLHHYSYASHPYFGRRYFPGFYRFHRFHSSAPSYRHAYRADHRNTYHAATRNRGYGGDRWQGSYRTGVRPREYNDHNYPRRHASRSSVRTDHNARRSTVRGNSVTRNRSATRSTSSTRTATTVSNRLHTTGRVVNAGDADRNTSRTRHGANRVADTRRPATVNDDARRTTTTFSRDRSATRSETSREASRRSAATPAARASISRWQAGQRDSNASRSASRQRPVSTNRSSDAGRSSARQRSASNNRSNEAGRSSSRQRPASNSRRSDASRSPVQQRSTRGSRSVRRSDSGRPVSRR